MPAQSYLMPSIIPSEAGFNIVNPSELSISPLTGVESIAENAGERWYVDLFYKFLPRAHGLDLKSHLMKLRGSTNKSLIRDLSYTNRGTWAGTPRVNGSDEYGLQLNIDGLTSNQQSIVELDRFKLNGRVHEVLNSVNPGSGNSGVLQLANEIIDIPADNTELITDPTQLTIACRWTDPRQIQQFKGNRRYFRDVRLTFMESLA